MRKHTEYCINDIIVTFYQTSASQTFHTQYHLREK